MFNDYARNMSRNIYDSKQEGTEFKILTAKQMLQRLPISLAQIKAGNNSQSLLNEIRQIVYYLSQSKEITKKVYNNMTPHPLTNFEIQTHYQNEPRFIGVYSRDNLPDKIKDGEYVINLDEYYDLGTHWIAYM